MSTNVSYMNSVSFLSCVYLWVLFFLSEMSPASVDPAHVLASCLDCGGCEKAAYMQDV